MIEQGISEREIWLFEDELISEIAKVFARIPDLAHHHEEDFKSYAADIVGLCRSKAIEKLKSAE